MIKFPSSKSKQVLAALKRKGWSIKKQSGSHITLSKSGYEDYTFAFHDSE